MPFSACWRSLAAISSLAAGVLTGPLDLARAEPAPPFDVLLAQARGASPRLAESLAQVRQAEGTAQQATVRPNPSAELTVENIGPRTGGLDQRETTLAVAQPFELGGKRPARIAAGEAGVAAARARLAQARAEFAADLEEAYARAEAADRRLALAEEAAGLAKQDERAARALVDAGKEAEVRAIQAGAAVASARAEVQTRRGEREAAFAQLTALAGSPAPFTSIPQGLLDAPRPAPRTTTPLDTAAYVAAQADRAAAARRVRLEQARSTPDLTVSVGVRRLAAENATALVAGVSAPIPVFDQNRGAISAARAELAAAEARLNAARLDAEANLRAGRARYEAAGVRIDAARNTEEAADQAYRLTRLGYEGGKLPLSEVIAARRALAEAKGARLDAQLDRVAAEAALARLSPQPIDGAS